MMEENSKIMTDENGVRHCTQCENHCPENALKCGRGRKLFGVTEGAEGEEHRDHGDHPHHGHHDHDHGHHHHDHQGKDEE